MPTPTDRLTGLPLPLLPLDDYGPDTSWHHHQHPRRHPLLQQQGLGGQAVRGSRLQLYNHRLHYVGYHSYYEGPPLPKTPEERFTTIIMCMAGYIPHQAIDMRSGEPRIVDMDPKLCRRLQTSGELRMGQETTIRRFIRAYVMSHALATIDMERTSTEEFLETNDVERKRDLGFDMLGIIIARAVEPAADMYFQAQRDGLLMPTAAETIQQFTKTRLGTIRKRHKMINSLHSRLMAAA